MNTAVLIAALLAAAPAADRLRPEACAALACATRLPVLPVPIGAPARGARLEGQTGAADPWFAADKFRHFFAAWAAVSLGYASARTTGLAHDTSLTIGVAGSALAGILKEIADSHAGRVASPRDLAWDLLGILGATLVLR